MKNKAPGTRDDLDDLRVLRFADLRAAGIVSNWPTLNRWIDRERFPRPIKLGPNSTAWRLSEVRQWLNGRERAGEGEKP